MLLRSSFHSFWSGSGCDGCHRLEKWAETYYPSRGRVAGRNANLIITNVSTCCNLRGQLINKATMIYVFNSESNISLRSNGVSMTQKGIIVTVIKILYMDSQLTSIGKAWCQLVTSQIRIIVLSSMILFLGYVSMDIWRSYVSRNGPRATNILNPILTKDWRM